MKENCLPLIAGEEFPVALRYVDNKISTRFEPLKWIKSIHLEDGEVSLEELTIPMSYLNALQNCRQIRKRLMTEKQAKIIYQHFAHINEVLRKFGADTLKESRYWLETPASKSYLAKAIDFKTGKVMELKRSESCRVRPMVFM